MNKMYFLGCMGILAASAMLSSCSSDNDDPTPSPNPGSEVVYKWTTNGGLKACDHILFGTDDKENGVTSKSVWIRHRSSLVLSLIHI